MSEPKKIKITTAKAISDVAHPGKSAPSDTSKPIITHRPRMKDPMVMEEGSADETQDTSKKLATKQVEVKIIPPEPEAVEDEPAKDETPAAEKSDDTEVEETAAPEPVETEVPASDDSVKAEAEVSPDKKSKKQPDLDAEAAEQAEHEAKIQKLIDSKKYVLPINAVEQRRSKRFVALGILLAILLALAWVDVALDAGLIQISNIKPVTHFFSN